MTPKFKQMLNRAVAIWLDYSVKTWDEAVSPRQDYKEAAGSYYGPYILCDGKGELATQYGKSSIELAWGECPNFCEDRNLLEQIWEHGGSQYKTYDYVFHMSILVGVHSSWHIATAKPHIHLIAALKACGQWTPDLEETWKECQG